MHVRKLNTKDYLCINARRYSRSQRAGCPRAITDSAITLSRYFTDTISQREADSCGFRQSFRDDTITSLALELQFMVAGG